jgi:hypothetical protein
MTLNQWVPGSSPGGRTENPVTFHGCWISFCLAVYHFDSCSSKSGETIGYLIGCPVVRLSQEHLVPFAWDFEARGVNAREQILPARILEEIHEREIGFAQCS